MNEQAFQAEVVKLCDKHEIKYFHSTDSRKDLGKGFPDLVLVGIDDVLFVELKTSNGKMSPAQTQWRYSIIAAGQRFEIWRPSDLSNGIIEAIISNL